MLKALIDADVLTYASAWSAQKALYHVFIGTDPRRTFESAKERDAFLTDRGLKKDDVKIEVEFIIESLGRALLVAERKLNAILDELQTTRFEAYLTGKGNFRETLAVTKVYKGNRKQEKPHWYQQVRDYYCERGAVVVDGCEADDALGVRLCELGEDACIASIDKDLIQIPGKHYDWDKNTKYRVDPETALRFFMSQLVSGDPTDNIPGVAKWGPKKAATLVKEGTVSEAWTAVTKLYAKTFKDDAERMLQEQGALLWIRRKRGEAWTIESFQQEYLKHEDHAASGLGDAVHPDSEGGEGDDQGGQRGDSAGAPALGAHGGTGGGPEERPVRVQCADHGRDGVVCDSEIEVAFSD